MEQHFGWQTKSTHRIKQLRQPQKPKRGRKPTVGPNSTFIEEIVMSDVEEEQEPPSKVQKVSSPVPIIEKVLGPTQIVENVSSSSENFQNTSRYFSEKSSSTLVEILQQRQKFQNKPQHTSTVIEILDDDDSVENVETYPLLQKLSDKHRQLQNVSTLPLSSDCMFHLLQYLDIPSLLKLRLVSQECLLFVTRHKLAVLHIDSLDHIIDYRYFTLRYAYYNSVLLSHNNLYSIMNKVVNDTKANKQNSYEQLSDKFFQLVDADEFVSQFQLILRHFNNRITKQLFEEKRAFVFPKIIIREKWVNDQQVSTVDATTSMIVCKHGRTVPIQTICYDDDFFTTETLHTKQMVSFTKEVFNEKHMEYHCYATGDEVNVIFNLEKDNCLKEYVSRLLWYVRNKQCDINIFLIGVLTELEYKSVIETIDFVSTTYYFYAVEDRLRYSFSKGSRNIQFYYNPASSLRCYHSNNCFERGFEGNIKHLFLDCEPIAMLLVTYSWLMYVNVSYKKTKSLLEILKQPISIE